MKLPSKLFNFYKLKATSLSYWLIAIFSFFVFTQSAFRWWPNQSFAYGIAIDYLSPTLYLTDIIFLLLFFVVLSTTDLRKRLFTKNTQKQFLLLTGLMLINSAVSIFVFATMLKWIKIFEIYILWKITTTLNKKQFYNFVFKPLVCSLPIILAIAIYQMINGTNTGVFQLLGERLINTNYPGIAKRIVFGTELLRPYSTFSHPNSLAGFLVTLYFLNFYFLKEKLVNKAFAVLVFAVLLLGIVLTLSYSALLVAVLLSIFLLFFPKNIFKYAFVLFIIMATASFLLPGIAKYLLLGNLSFSQNIYQRLIQYSFFDLNTVKEFLFGLGFNTFVKYQNTQPFQAYSFQPIHNGPLLLLKEGGLLLIVFFGLFVYNTLKKALSSKELLVAVLCFVSLSLFDHYQATLQQNLLINSFLFGLVWREKI